MMGKLVRDLIPDIIEADGKIAVTEILDDYSYFLELEIKLKEEVEEYLNATNKTEAIEELADIMEVMLALEKVLEGNIEEVRRNKAEKRGGFEDKIYLIEVKNN